MSNWKIAGSKAVREYRSGDTDMCEVLQGDVISRSSDCTTAGGSCTSVPVSVVATLLPDEPMVEALRSRGYVIHAPGAEADWARSDAKIARLTVEVERAVYDDAVSPEEHWRLKRALIKIVGDRIAAKDETKEGA